MLSVFISFGICLRLNFNSILIVNWLLPYFVAGIGFENMLVLTKSVTTIQFQHLDPKVRVAQGLATEGLSITKNLVAMLTLLTIGSFAFVQIFRVSFLCKFSVLFIFFTGLLHFCGRLYCVGFFCSGHIFYCLHNNQYATNQCKFMKWT